MLPLEEMLMRFRPALTEETDQLSERLVDVSRNAGRLIGILDELMKAKVFSDVTMAISMLKTCADALEVDVAMADEAWQHFVNEQRMSSNQRAYVETVAESEKTEEKAEPELNNVVILSRWKRGGKPN